MASKAFIANLALHRIGISQLISNVDTEQSQQAVSIKAMFDGERDAVLREFSWPFATAYATLGLVAGTAAVPFNDDWIFAYRYPPDALHARRLVTASGRSPAGQGVRPPAFRVGRDAQGRLIFSNETPAVLEYTARIVNVEEFDPQFNSMLAWRLASTIAAPLSRLENQAQRAMNMYVFERAWAQSTAANEGQKPRQRDADWTLARGAFGDDLRREQDFLTFINP